MKTLFSVLGGLSTFVLFGFMFAAFYNAPDGGEVDRTEIGIAIALVVVLNLLPIMTKGALTADYSDSVLLDGIGKLTTLMNEKTLRREQYGALDAYVLNREFSLPELAELRTAERRAVKTKYLKRTSGTPGSSRTCTPSASLGDSGNIDITWTTYSDTFKTTDKVFRNNEFSSSNQLANDMFNTFLDLYTKIETDVVAHLEANKTGVNVGTLGTFDTVNDIMEIANADRDNYLNYIRTMMLANKYSGTLIDVHTINLDALYREQRNQGESNDRNDAFQFSGFDHFPSLSITNASDHFGTSYILETNSVAIADWIPAANREGVRQGDRTWTTMPDPFGYPWSWSVFRVESCSDTSSEGGNTQDPVITWEVSLDLSLNVAPIDVSDETPIFKHALLSS